MNTYPCYDCLRQPIETLNPLDVTNHVIHIGEVCVFGKWLCDAHAEDLLNQILGEAETEVRS